MQDTRLAAIMFTDIAGYSRLMEEDEVRTISILHEHNDIVFPLIERASGTIVDAIGDGLLVTFPSVLVAVRCAVEIQNAVAERNSGKPEDRQFLLRIGIHLGEIWEEGNRVLGNGVNVAARVQPFAAPGGICVSEDVYRQVQNKIDLPAESIGTPDLKNIARPIELFSLQTGHEAADDGGATRRSEGRPASRGSGDSIDVIKERILQERAKIAEKRNKGSSTSDLGQAIENRVFNIVDRVMDAAIDKWEKLPPEKRREALEAGEWHASKDSPQSVIVTSGRHGKKKKDDDEKSGNDLAIGAVFAGGFGAGYFIFGIGWMIWPFFIIGVLPMLAGVGKLVKRTMARRAAAKSRPERLEREVLKAAKELGGRVTVVQLSAHTDLSLDDAQQTLDRMCAKGYVSQEILDNGTVVYDFPALASR